MEPPSLPYQPKSPRKWSFIKLVLAWAAAIAIAIGLQAFVFQSYQVFGQSMQPTLEDGDYLIISKVGQTWSQVSGNSYVPERGDIVVVEPGNSPRLIKRVVGLPGERIVVRDGTLRIFNSDHPEGFQPYQEFGIQDRSISGDIEVSTPEGHIFVVGDNTEGNGSSDSRNQLGTVSADDVIGSLVLRLWPLNDARLF